MFELYHAFTVVDYTLQKTIAKNGSNPIDAGRLDASEVSQLRIQLHKKKSVFLRVTKQVFGTALSL